MVNLHQINTIQHSNCVRVEGPTMLLGLRYFSYLRGAVAVMIVCSWIYYAISAYHH